MAEHTNDSSIGSSQGVNGTLLIDAGSKSPSKPRKLRKGSIFKKSSHDEGSSSKIIGGRAKRKSSRDKKMDYMEASEVEPPQQNVPEIGSTSTVHQSRQSDEAESHHYEIQTQEQEQKSTGDLSVKQFHKLNRQLAKERKSVDALKKEREVLVCEKVKLKSENKALERELKKTGSKSDLYRMSKKQSQMLSMEESVFNLEELRLKVIDLENHLAERDRKITVLRLTHSNGNDGIEIEGEVFPSGILTTSESMLDSTTTLQRLLEEQDNSLKLRKENADLRAFILTMDAELDKVNRESNPSPRSPRKRSSGFFKRGKKNTSSMPSRYMSGDGPLENVQGQKRSESPVMGKAESNQALDISISPFLSRANKESTISLPSYSSPNQSPQISKRNSDLDTLQACLKLALNEKSFFEENVFHLQKELDGAQGKIQELESTQEVMTNREIEKIQKSLTAAKIDRDTYFDELKICQQEVDEMTEKFNKLEKSYTAAREKIKELEEEVEALRYSGFSSLSRSSSNISSLKIPTPVSSPKDKIVSSPKDKVSSTEKFKYSTFPSQHNRSIVEPKTVASESTSSTSSTSDTSRQSKVKSLSRKLSIEKPIFLPSSPSKKVGKLSRASSIDQFETHKEIVTNNKVSGIPPPSLSHGFATKVAATRAIFEQKIDQTKINHSQARHSSKTMENEEQKRRFSMIVNSTSLAENRSRSISVLPKSNSYDQSARQPYVLKSPGTPVEKVPEIGQGRFDKSKSVPPTNVRNAYNGASAVDNERNKTNTAHKQLLEKTPSLSTVCVQSNSSPTSKAPNSTLAASPTKVSKITFTSTATLSSLPISKDPSLKLGRRESSPSALLLRGPISPSHMTLSPTTSSHTRFQQRVPGNVTTTTVRRANPSLNAPSSDDSSTAPDKTVIKSPTKVKVHPPVRSWNSNIDKQSSKTINNSSIATTTSSFSRSIPKLQDKKMISPITKVGSLQNIQSCVSNDVSIPTQTPTQNMGNVSASSTSPYLSGIRRGSNHRGLQRRERKDRPKTMFVGSSPESSSLVNLISKFQQEEKDKKLKDVRASTGSGLSSLANKPSINGTSLTSTSFVSGSISSVPPTVSSSACNINQRQTSNKPKPLTFYGGTSTSSTRNLASSYSHLNNKPAHAKLRRAQTVGLVSGGLVNNRMSKKAMLLKWCQIMTQNYENVKIDNFAESFSNGLAFCALMHHFIPDQVAFNTLTPINREKNFKIAFEAAEGVGIPSLLPSLLGILMESPREALVSLLLKKVSVMRMRLSVKATFSQNIEDVEDMVSLPIPDWMSVMTYVSFIYNRFGQENQQQQNSII